MPNLGQISLFCFCVPTWDALAGAVQIILHLCLIKLPDGSGRVVKAGEKISADIVDFLRTLTQAVKHILDMRFVQLPKAGTYRLDRNFLPPDLDSGLRRSQNIGNQVCYPFNILFAIFLHKLVKTNIFHHLLPARLPIHLISRRLDRWIGLVPLGLIIVSIITLRFSEVCTSVFPKS